MKTKVKTVANSLGWECFGNYNGVPFNLPLNYIWNINFFLFNFLKYCDFMFFVISIFAVVKECVVNNKCIFMLLLVFVRHFLVSLLVLFWSKFVRAAISIMLLPFCFAALNLSIYLSIYLPICLYEVICPSFLKAVLSAKTVPFIKTVCREIQTQTKALYELYWVV